MNQSWGSEQKRIFKFTKFKALDSRYSTQSERDKKVRKEKIIQFKVVTLINAVYEKVGDLIWKKFLRWDPSSGFGSAPEMFAFN